MKLFNNGSLYGAVPTITESEYSEEIESMEALQAGYVAYDQLLTLEAMDVNSASPLYDLAMETIVTPMGLDAGEYLTSESLAEGIKNLASKTWKTIVKVFKKIGEMIKNAYLKVKGWIISAKEAVFGVSTSLPDFSETPFSGGNIADQVTTKGATINLIFGTSTVSDSGSASYSRNDGTTTIEKSDELVTYLTKLEAALVKAEDNIKAATAAVEAMGKESDDSSETMEHRARVLGLTKNLNSDKTVITNTITKVGKLMKNNEKKAKAEAEEAEDDKS